MIGFFAGHAWAQAHAAKVAFQPVPPISSLTVPPGRPIFAAKAFKPVPSKLVHSASEGLSDGYAGKGNYF